VVRYGYSRNWFFLLQRITGLITLGFIALHLWQYRIQKLLHVIAWQNFYHQLQVDLGEPGMFVVYFLGITSAVFHFANGLWLFGNTWGITTGTRGMRRSAMVCAFVGVLLWALGINTLLHFGVRCGGLIPMPEQEVQAHCRDANALQIPIPPPAHQPTRVM
jgi:succinate dehydrogenase / fumarate reductase cytochrome b subunit